MTPRKPIAAAQARLAASEAIAQAARELVAVTETYGGCGCRSCMCEHYEAVLGAERALFAALFAERATGGES